MLGVRAHTCLNALKTGARQLGGHPVMASCMHNAAGSIGQRASKVFGSSPLVRNMSSATNEVTEGDSGENAVDSRRIRPVVTPAERRKELYLYKQQVHELRVQYKKEWEEKVVASEKLRAERAAEFWKKVEEYRRIRDEKAKVRRTIAEEAMARLREEKAAEKVEKRERQASWKTTQVEKSRERFSMQLIESRDWSCEKDEVYQLVHEALVDPAKPRYVNPARRYTEEQ